MSKLRVLLMIAGLLLLSSGTISAQAVKVTCKDGTKSAGGQGACSSHGGVSGALKVTCTDGTMSAGGQGACSSHGGIATKAAAKADAKMAKADAKMALKADAKSADMALKADSKAAKVATKSADQDAKGATAMCKDNTYSHAKSAQGMCSGHGGVAKLLTTK
jgi:hypothetical protein